VPILPAAGRQDLADDEWRVLGACCPGGRSRAVRPGGAGGSWSAGSTGGFGPAPWRDVPARYGPWQSVYGLFHPLAAGGTWREVMTALRALADASGHVTGESLSTRLLRGRTMPLTAPGVA
jgi:transposase